MTVQLRANAEDLIQFSTRAVTPAMGSFVKGGIAAGTLVQTVEGAIPVENLRAGQSIVTRECGAVPLVATRAVKAAACTIRTDSLGLARPVRDITVASDQHVTLRDWRAEALFDAAEALVPVNRLTDGAQITAIGTVELFRLDLGAPLTIFANGLETPTGRTESDVIDMAEIG